MSMTRLVHGIVSLDPPTIRCDDRTFTVTLTAEQIDLIVELLPQPLERELLEEDLSATDKSEVRREMDEVGKILEILLDAQEGWTMSDQRTIRRPAADDPTERILKQRRDRQAAVARNAEMSTAAWEMECAERAAYEAEVRR